MTTKAVSPKEISELRARTGAGMTHAIQSIACTACSTMWSPEIGVK